MQNGLDDQIQEVKPSNLSKFIFTSKYKVFFQIEVQIPETSLLSLLLTSPEEKFTCGETIHLSSGIYNLHNLAFFVQMMHLA